MAGGIVLWRFTASDVALVPAICPIDGHLTDAFIWTSSASQTIADCYFNDSTGAGSVRAFYKVQASDGFSRFPFDAPLTNPNVDVDYDSSIPASKPFNVLAGEPLYAESDEVVSGSDVVIFGFVIASGQGATTVAAGQAVAGLVGLGRH